MTSTLFSTGESQRNVNPSAPDANRVVVFSSLERTGVIIMAVAGVISCALVSILLLYITMSALAAWSPKLSSRSDSFTNKQIAVFLTCLLLSDLIQSISGITQVKWAIEGRIYEGRSCTIQGHTHEKYFSAATLVMGDLGSTVCYTHILRNHDGEALAPVVDLAFLVPLGLSKPERGPFFSIAGTWCFISSEYAVPRLVIHYVPLFVAAFLIIVLYGLIFRFLRKSAGLLQSSGSFPRDVISRQRMVIGKRMLWYPVVYLTCILPIAVTRITGFQDENVPEGVWIVCMFFLFSLEIIGAMDSVIYATTRRVIAPINLPFHLAPDTSNTRIVELEMSDSSDKAPHLKQPLDCDELSVDNFSGCPPVAEQVIFKNGMNRMTVAEIIVTREQIQEAI
ncbi:hypothetical protein K439DRAFT_1619974 [Ramaria rubella]|nr:hypothetical protein K439DRAFT_1619974 [Ramaria rubella]